MGISNKYGRVTTERGSIGDDEPVVVFRAKDALLTGLLREYYKRCQRAGSPQKHLDLIASTSEIIKTWQEEHFTKVPTSDLLGPDA